MPLEALATLIAVNITPVAGILFLGWSPGGVLITYFVDTLLTLGAMALLVVIHVTGDGHRPIRGWLQWTKALFGLSVLGALVALPLSLPLWFTIGDDRRTWALLTDRGFVSALAVQASMSALAALRLHRELTRRSDDDRVLAGRVIIVVARWFALVVALVTGLVSLLGPTVGSFVLVVVYGAASVYFELFPEKAVQFLRGRNAKPIVFEGDLESRMGEHAGGGASAGPGTPNPPAPQR